MFIDARGVCVIFNTLLITLSLSLPHSPFLCLQFAHYKDEMYLHAQRAFGVNPDRHYRLLHASAEDKPKIIVLSAVVIEADGLEAKDANGKQSSSSLSHPLSPSLSPLVPLSLLSMYQAVKCCVLCKYF